MTSQVAGGGRIAISPEPLMRLAAACGEAVAELAVIRLEATATAQAVGEDVGLDRSLTECERWLRGAATGLFERIRFLLADERVAWAMSGIGMLKGIDKTSHGLEAVALHKQLRRAWGLYERAIGTGAFGRYGDLGSLGRWFAWQETVSAWGLPLDWARAATHMGDEALELGKTVGFGKVAVKWSQLEGGTRILRGAGWTRALTKALGPVGFVSDVIVIRKGSEYEGARGVADQAVAGLSLGWGVAAVGATAAGIATAPAIVTIAGGVAVGAAVWSVGNLAWDNRDEIASAVTSAAEWTGEQISDATDAIGDAADAVAEGVGDAVEGVADAVTFWN